MQSPFSRKKIKDVIIEEPVLTEEPVVKEPTELELIQQEVDLKHKWVSHLTNLQDTMGALDGLIPHLKYYKHPTVMFEDRVNLEGATVNFLKKTVAEEYDRLIELGYQGWVAENDK